MSYDFPLKILFKHCDPAGIVFFPRYFEMINDCVEAFFDDIVKIPFEELLITAGVPTAEIRTQFKAPSRHGDRIVLTLECQKVGRSSLDLNITAKSLSGEVRFVANSTLVYVDSAGRPKTWPDHMKQKFTEELKGPN